MSWYRKYRASIPLSYLITVRCAISFYVAGHGPTFFQELEDAIHNILQTEEYLLDALCFDFVVDSPHGDLVILFNAHEVSPSLEDHSFSIAHDS